MNKYIIILGVLILIIVSGAVYRAKFVAEIDKPIVTGIERAVTIVTFENTWKFEPEFLEVDQGDKVIMTITNRDDYDHGFAIDAFGISQRMPAKSTISIDFVVTKAGDFPYYCSVSCGSGIVDSVKRGHFDQVGKLHVRSAISETTNFGETESTVDFAKEARDAAMIKEASRKLGVDESEIQIDIGNKLWLQAQLANENFITVPYQALYNGGVNARTWVFIDTSTGEVIQTMSFR